MVADGSSQRANSRIFISYRRDETAFAAGWLFDRLSGHFGHGQVFKDVDSIEPGQDFVAEIRRAVGSCDALLALIGNTWLTIRADNDRLRLEDPSDYVRLEIEAALQRDIRVIPILVDGATMPSPEELPAGMGDLVFRQAFELSHSRFDSDSERLVHLLDRILSDVQVAPPSGSDEPRDRSAQRRTRRRRVGLLAFAGLVALTIALVVSINWWTDQKGGPSAATSGPKKTDVPTTTPVGRALPESDPLPDDALVIPRDVGSSLRLYRVSSKPAIAPALLTDTRDARGPALSPNRRTIIYVRGLDATQVRVMAADGTGDRRLFPKPPSGCKNVLHLAWSPTDADLLALACGSTKILLVHGDGTVIRTLATGSKFVDDPTFSPDGSKIAYWASPDAASESGSLYTIATSGGSKPKRLTFELIDADPVWSPHGNQLTFCRTTTEPGGLPSSSIYSIDAAAGGSPTPLATELGENEKPAWSPSGDTIAYVHTAPGATGPGSKDVWVRRVGLSVAPPRALGINATAMGTPIWGHR